MTILPVLIDLAAAVSSVLLIVGVVRLRGRGTPGPVHDVLEGAFLAGGPGRVTDTALAAMQADGRLVVADPGIVALRHPLAHNAVEHSLIQAHAAAPSGALRPLRHAVMLGRAVQEVGDGLAARGLLVAPDQARTYTRWGAIQAVAGFVGVPFSFVLAAMWTMGRASAASLVATYSLPPVMIVTVIVGLSCAAVARNRVTRAGRDALRDFRARFALSTHPAFLVAAGGLPALPDPVLRQHLLTASRNPAGDDFTRAHQSAGSPALWCASSTPGSGGGCGSGGGSSCGGGSSGSSCGGGAAAGAAAVAGGPAAEAAAAGVAEAAAEAGAARRACLQSAVRPAPPSEQETPLAQHALACGPPGVGRCTLRALAHAGRSSGVARTRIGVIGPDTAYGSLPRRAGLPTLGRADDPASARPKGTR